MGKTISTHNGSVANREHNVRNPRATDKQKHIDKSLKGQNEILHDEKPREAYRRIFGEALAEYNAKQSRPERRIRDYFAHVEKDSKKHTVYEMIAQIGDRTDTGIDAPVERECLKEFYAGWKERNPHLECIGAYLHADESDGTLHMHVDYVPVATGYTRGMSVQNGLVKALEQQGFVKDGAKTAQIQWEARENAALERICERHGIEVVHPMVKKRKHLDTEVYKAQQKVDFAYEQYQVLMGEIDKIQADLEDAKEEASRERDKASETRQQLVDGANTVKKLREVTNTLEAKKTSLEGKIEALEGKQKQLEDNLPELEERVEAARFELEVTEKAIKEKKVEGAKQFGWATLDQKIAEARKDIEKDRRISALEREVNIFKRFIEWAPKAVKDLFVQFQGMLQREKGNKPRER